MAARGTNAAWAAVMADAWQLARQVELGVESPQADMIRSIAAVWKAAIADMPPEMAFAIGMEERVSGFLDHAYSAIAPIYPHWAQLGAAGRFQVVVAALFFSKTYPPDAIDLAFRSARELRAQPIAAPGWMRRILGAR